MSLSTWSIRHPVAVVLLFALLALGGVASFTHMKVQEFPDLELPTVVLTTSRAGASASQMETEVVKPLETALGAVPGIKRIASTIEGSLAVITAEFELHVASQQALDTSRDAVARVRPDLPATTREPELRKLELSDAVILVYAVTSPRMDATNLGWFVDNDVGRALRALPGVGAVTRVGGASREVRVELDPAQLASLGVTVAEVSNAIRAAQQDTPSGRMSEGGGEQTLRTASSARMAGDLALLDLPLPEGRRVRLGSLAKVYDTTAEPSSHALVNGQTVVALEIQRSRGASEIEVERSVDRATSELMRQHPDLQIRKVQTAVEPVVQNYRGSLGLLLEGAVLAVLVVGVYLRDWRATLMAAAALPLSVLPAFLGMWTLGYSLNAITLLALSLVVGILVDDAIVELENIVRHQRRGLPPMQAAMHATDEIGLAVVATTSTLIVVFLPTAFMGGVTGRFFQQFGLTACLAVLASLLVARMLTPMLAAHLLTRRNGPARPTAGRTESMRLYLRLVAWCLRHRAPTLMITAALLLAAVAVVPFLSTGFIPEDDLSQTSVRLQLPPGMALHRTLATAEAARQLLAGHVHVQRVYTAVGTGTSAGNAAGRNIAHLTLGLTPQNLRPGVRKQDIERELRRLLETLPGVRVQVGGDGGDTYSLMLQSKDVGALLRTARDVERELRSMDGLGSITSDAGLQQPEWMVKPDNARASAAGVSAAQIAEVLRMSTVGDDANELAQLDLEQRQIPIVVRLPDAVRLQASELGLLMVPGAWGPVRLNSVANIELGSGPARIERSNQMRTVTITIGLNGRSLGDVADAVQALPSVRQLPAGVQASPQGEAADQDELFQNFGLAMLVSAVCIYAVLVLLFNSFLHPLGILVSLPLSLGGAFVALWLLRQPLALPAVIGLVLLMGLATKNAILLVDHALTTQRCGARTMPALLRACRLRARPIVMTSVAMGAGMLPIALGWGADPSFRQSMAIAVLGGVVSSTALCLVVVPVVYACFNDLALRVKPRAPRSM